MLVQVCQVCGVLSLATYTIHILFKHSDQKSDLLDIEKPAYSVSGVLCTVQVPLCTFASLLLDQLSLLLLGNFMNCVRWHAFIHT